jgi:hypothetical protein
MVVYFVFCVSCFVFRVPCFVFRVLQRTTAFLRFDALVEFRVSCSVFRLSRNNDLN